PGGHTMRQRCSHARWLRKSGRGQAHLVTADGKSHLMANRYVGRRHHELLTIWSMQHRICRSRRDYPAREDVVSANEARHKRRPWLVIHLARCPPLLNVSVLHDDNQVCECQSLFLTVGDMHKGDA